MAQRPIVSCEEAAEHLEDASWLFVDCRYDLMDKDKGVREYANNHVPGALFAHIDRDLSGPVGDGHRGRHPLPLQPSFQRWCGLHGIGPDTMVVAYDDQAGQWASRLWWLLRHYGHAKVAVLDGGLTRWKALKLPLKPGHESARKETKFTGTAGSMPMVDSAILETGLGKPAAYQLVDARAGERFRGEVEPVDKKAGHIPGAISMPFGGNVGDQMRFLPAEKLLERYEKTLGVQEVGRVACYCGSGVTGPHNILAMELAGMGTPALYPGSWSEWSWPEAARPIETGETKKPTA
ncbi:MAG: sulfurtransferase [Candidatus Thermoplasmatota archaeon]